MANVARKVVSGYIGVGGVARKFYQTDGEYGSDKIAGTLAKGEYVRFDGQDWIVANISGNEYTLMLKKMSANVKASNNSTSAFSFRNSLLYEYCLTFEGTMSSSALSAVAYHTVELWQYKVWIATKSNIESWTDSANPTSSAWYGIRKWTGSSEDDYAASDIYYYWCSDPYDSSLVWRIRYNGNFGYAVPSIAYGFRPCIVVIQ